MFSLFVTQLLLICVVFLRLLQQLHLISLGVILQVLIWLFFMMTCILVGDLICLWYIPTGRTGTAFFSELAILIQSFADDTVLNPLL